MARYPYVKRDKLATSLAFYCLVAIRSSAWFPVKTGKLRDQATYQTNMPGLIGASASAIVFDSSVAPYIPFLEDGTKAHNIPGAFGFPLPFGIGGRFDGKFHPGSVKHKGFIEDKATQLAYETVLEYCKMRVGKVVYAK